MKKPLPYFSCYPGDFFSDPRFNRLPGDARGTWCQLVLLMWHQGTETQLPDDDEEISFYLNIDLPTWINHRELFEKLGLLQVDHTMKRISNNRLAREYGIADAKCQQNRKNIQKRWGADQEDK